MKLNNFPKIKDRRLRVGLVVGGYQKPFWFNSTLS